MLPIERDEARMRKKQKKTAAEEQQELVLNLGDRERFSLPSADEVAREEREGLELQTAQQRIQDVLRVLGNFGQEREKEMSREQYVKQLKRDLAFYYGYNKFLISQILRLFSPPEAVEFLESNETPRPVTIRCNTLKVIQFLSEVFFRFSEFEIQLGSSSRFGSVAYCTRCEFGSDRMEQGRIAGV